MQSSKLLEWDVVCFSLAQMTLPGKSNSGQELVLEEDRTTYSSKGVRQRKEPSEEAIDVGFTCDADKD